MGYPKRKTRITYEGLSFLSILAFIVLGSILRQINLLVLLSGLMMAPFFFNWRISRKMLQSVSCRRKLPQWIHAGTPVVIPWQVNNHRTRIPSWEIRISDRLQFLDDPAVPAGQVEVLMHQVEPGSKATAGFRCTIHQRGLVTLGPAIACSAFPLGLVRTSMHLPDRETLYVAPAVGKLRPGWHRMIHSRDSSVEQINSRRKGNSNEDFFSLRTWRHGDSKRMVHWRSSAKRSELVVRQGVDSGSRRVTVLIDMGPASQDSVEWLASLAATIAVRAPGFRQSGQLSIGICGDDSLNPLVPGPMTMPHLMRFLASVGPAESTSIGDAVKKCLSRLRTGDQLIVYANRSRDDALPSTKWPAGRSGPALNWINVCEEDSFFESPLVSPAGVKPQGSVAGVIES